jgi:hypothetical protein
MAKSPPSKAVDAADMVYRLSIGDLKDPLAKAYMLARTLVHLGYHAYVTESSLFPVFFTDRANGWLIDLAYADGPKIISTEFTNPRAMILEFNALPWDDLDAMAQLLVRENIS